MISISQCSQKSIELIYNTFWSDILFPVILQNVKGKFAVFVLCIENL